MARLITNTTSAVLVDHDLGPLLVAPTQLVTVANHAGGQVGDLLRGHALRKDGHQEGT